MSDFMKWLLSDLAVDNNQKMFYKETIKPDIKNFESVTRLKAINPFNINGVWYYDEISDYLYTEFNLSGKVVISDSITLEDTDFYIDVNTTEVFSFDQIDDVADHLVKDNAVDLTDIINQVIVANIPFKVRKDDSEEYPKGDNWEIMSEADFNKLPKKVNPQMAKLLDLEIDDEQEVLKWQSQKDVVPKQELEKEEHIRN